MHCLLSNVLCPTTTLKVFVTKNGLNKSVGLMTQYDILPHREKSLSMVTLIIGPTGGEILFDVGHKLPHY